VAAIGIPVEFGQILHQTGTQRVEMDVPNNLGEIGVFVTDDGLVPILK